LNGSEGPGAGWRGPYLYATLNFTGAANEAARKREFPWVFSEFDGDPLIRGLVTRFEDYLKGRERLPVVGYFTLSALEHAFGDRQKLSSCLAFGDRVLSTLGRLVSGADLRTLQETGGWSDLSLVERYAHTSVSRAAEAVEKMSRSIQKVASVVPIRSQAVR
jgi:hypothetical protein